MDLVRHLAYPMQVGSCSFRHLTCLSWDVDLDDMSIFPANWALLEADSTVHAAAHVATLHKHRIQGVLLGTNEQHQQVSLLTN